MARSLVLVILVVLGAAAGIFFYTQHSARSRLSATRGHADGAVVARGEHGGILVVIDRVSKAGAHRLTAVDLATGATLGSRVIDEPARCWPASAGKIWCGDGSGKVHLVGVPSFDATEATDADQASRTWLGHDGGCDFADALDLKGGHLTFGDGTPRPLVFHLAHEQGAEPATSTLPGTATFFSPAFVRTSDPDLLLVQHDAALDRPDAVELSRVGIDRQVRWTADLGGRCETAAASDGKIVVTTRDPAHRAVAIDAETGKIAWRFAFADDD